MKRLALLAVMALTAFALAERVRVPGTDISLELPAGFVQMPPDILKLKYSRGGLPPTSVYSTPGPSWAVNIAFALRNVALPSGDLTPARLSLERSLVGVPGFRWVRHELQTQAGREWIVLEFWVSGLDTPIYNSLWVTRQGENTLLVSANVTEKLYPDYAAPLRKAMQSLK